MLRLVFWCICLSAPSVSLAEIFTFDSSEKVGAYTLEGRRSFFIYSHLDPAAPKGPSGEKSYIQFHGLVPTAENSTSLKGYEGLQVSLIRYRKIVDVTSQKQFCRDGKLSVQAADKNPVASNTDNNDINIITVRPGAEARNVKIEVKESGSYYLLVSNCGSVDGVSVSGSIIVNSPHGFLPATEFNRLSFYAWLLFFYLVVSVLWMGLSLRWWMELVQIQIMIGCVMAVGLVEVSLWHAYLDAWNRNGVRGQFLFSAAVYMAVLKRGLSLVLCYAASLGWGMTIPLFPEELETKLLYLMTVYFVTGTVHEFFYSFRHTCDIRAVYLFLTSLPSTICIVVLSARIFSALNEQIAKVTERKQPEKLQIFQRLWYCLCFSAVAFSAASLLVGFDTFSGREYWAWSWFLSDGVSHLLFALILVVMMSLWVPNEHSLLLAFTHKAVAGKEKDYEKGKSTD